MQAPTLPHNEPARLAALHALRLLDTPRDESFDAITRLAHRVFGTQLAAVGLMDADRLWFKSSQGADMLEAPRAATFCSHVIRQGDPLVVHDALEDARFAHLPVIAGPPHLRFYAGHPVRCPQGHHVGTICVMDTRPRDWSAADAATLADLAIGVETAIRTHGLAECQELAHLKEDLLGAVSHELRTPLNLVYGALDLLSLPQLEAHKRAGLVDIASKNARRLARLLSDLLDAQAIRWGRFRVLRAPMDLEKAVYEAVAALADRAEAKDIVIRVACEPTAIEADHDRLVQLVSNLLENAIKHAPGGSRVDLSVGRHGDAMRLMVRDQGPGIPPDELELIFARFYQVPTPEERRAGGLGLGLAICRGIAEQHGGRLWAESAPGEGSAFHFELKCP